tara:strand:- start:571 stop:747 length:177 start_codon:yes stop_codon:yes gene_type:complete
MVTFDFCTFSDFTEEAFFPFDEEDVEDEEDVVVTVVVVAEAKSVPPLDSAPGAGSVST